MTTRAALVTPAGVSAIATIQIEGPKALDVLNTIFRPYRGGGGVFCGAEGLCYGTIFENEEVLDAVVVATDPAKKTIDIHCHGGPRIVQRLLMLLEQQEVEIVPWQQLPPAESIADEVQLTLPLAKTQLGVLAISAQSPGGLTAWIRSQITLLKTTPHALEKVKQNLHEMFHTYTIAMKLLHPATLSLVGAANVGKSTMANVFSGRQQSITANIPGTTRDWTSQLVNINGLPLYVIDTPGRRAPGDAIEEQAMKVADLQIQLADLIVLVIEAGVDENKQIAIQRSALPAEKDILIVANKIDLQRSASACEPATVSIAAKKPIYISALQETNLDALRSAIADYFGLADFDPAQPMIFTQRQFDLLSRAAQSGHSGAMLEILQDTLGSSSD